MKREKKLVKAMNCSMSGLRTALSVYVPPPESTDEMPYLPPRWKEWKVQCDNRGIDDASVLLEAQSRCAHKSQYYSSQAAQREIELRLQEVRAQRTFSWLQCLQYLHYACAADVFQLKGCADEYVLCMRKAFDSRGIVASADDLKFDNDQTEHPDTVSEWFSTNSGSGFVFDHTVFGKVVSPDLSAVDVQLRQ